LGKTVYAVNNVDLAVMPGEFLVILGPSGSGKSTLLSLLAGLDRPISGEVILDGHPLVDLSENELADLRRRKVGYVFQFFNLVAHLNAYDNVALPLKLTGAPEWFVRQRATELLSLVGLSGRMHHLPGQMSGGEQQRVAIARALANEPRIVFADEPTGNLDTRTGNQIRDLFRELNRDFGQTFVIVTHDDRFAELADRVVRLVDGRLADETVGGARR
jgi:predicted ABC-type transport system involved in lysophospholipase L1 biosynthesis ATPase subunit